ncbi:uncharacterized protein LOC135196263 [Macrobrachium nipponense]|uniref:uncharacterized protein LOC135196263 n=1 Tax=Macrobrachium nipponense TaxID=159736 RepID=UPI0030C7E597
MRTTGLRVAPSTRALESLDGEVTPTFSQTIHLTIDHSGNYNIKNEEHPNATFAVISQSLPPREGLASELARLTHRWSLCDLENFKTPVNTPPPKPPRAFTHGDTAKAEKEKKKRSVTHPGPPITPTALYELKKLDRKASVRSDPGEVSPPRPISCPPSHQTDRSKSCVNNRRSSTLSSTQSSPPGLDRTRSVSIAIGKSQMAWQSLRRRIFPEDAPPLPSTPPHPIPNSNSIFYPPLPSPPDSGPSTQASSPSTPTAVRPKVTQPSTQPNFNVRQSPQTQGLQSNATPPTATRPRQPTTNPSPVAGASGITTTQNGSHARVISDPETSRNSSVFDRGPITTISEFESTCKQVFHLQRNARDLMEQKQYNKAALKYQMALGLIDKVLKTRVLFITPHEPTRQRLFHLQEAVFSSRKESLNGFTDAQAAVDLPQELSMSAPPPGAPPSYQDVLREDRRRVRGAPPPVPVRPPSLNASTPANGVLPRPSQPQHRSQHQPHQQRGHPKPHPPRGQLPSRPRPPTLSQPSALPQRQLSTQPQQMTSTQRLQPHTKPQLCSPSNNQSQARCQPEEQSRGHTPASSQPQKPSRTNTVPPNSQAEMPPHGYASPNDQPETQPDSHLRHHPHPKTPPKPKPRTSVPKTQQQRTCQMPQATSPVASQPMLENPCENGAEINVSSKSEEDNNEVKLPQQSSEEYSDDTPLHNQSEIKEQPKQPAYLRNQAQPIGDLIRQASLRGINPLARTQRPISLISDGIQINAQIPGGSSQEDDKTKGESSIAGIKPRVPAQMSLPRPKSHYHQNKNTEFSPHISEEGLYDIPRHQPKFEAARHQAFGRDCSNSDSSNFSKAENHDHISEKLGTRPRPPKPARRKAQVKQVLQDQMNDLHSGEGPSASSAFITSENCNFTSKLGGSSESGDDLSKEDISHPRDTTLQQPRVQNTTGTAISDPFTDLDPFPPLIPGSVQSDVSFTENNTNTTSFLNTNDNCTTTSNTNTQPKREAGQLQTPIKPVHATEVLLQPVKSRVPSTNEATPTKNQSSSADVDLGNSILDALDFAVSPQLPQLPKERDYSRCQSEETLLDYSYNTLGRYLESAGSQFDVICEFDPLSSQKSSRSTLNENDVVCPDALEESGSNITLTANEEETKIDESYYAVPRKLKWKSPNTSDEKRDPPPEEVKDRRMIENPGNFYENTKTDALDDIYDKDADVASPYHIYAEVGTRSSVASSAGSVTSWPSETSRHPSSPSPTSPSTAGGGSSQDSCGPWSSNYEESEHEIADDIGRSSFYRANSSNQGSINSLSSSPLPPRVPEGFPGASSSTDSTREILRIREGVKIFFIYADGVITSPWNRPFLSVSKDASNPTHGSGVLLRVGRSLWSCELISKSTLVFKSDASTYVFKETNNKPECTAVAVRIPSTVRKVQHELLSRIMKDCTRLEEERPSGITKSVSKGAASAAEKVNKIVVNKEADFNQAFVRRNSIRALKGMSRRLNSLAEKTGSTLPELPEEYESLRDAASTLKISRSARTVQYI